MHSTEAMFDQIQLYQETFSRKPCEENCFKLRHISFSGFHILGPCLHTDAKKIFTSLSNCLHINHYLLFSDLSASVFYNFTFTLQSEYFNFLYTSFAAEENLILYQIIKYESINRREYYKLTWIKVQYTQLNTENCT